MTLKSLGMALLSVTMIAQPEPRRVGAQMIAMLLALLAGHAPSTLQVLWQPELAPGAGTGPYPRLLQSRSCKFR
jgi:LacI family transcriptional regulator